MDDKNIVRAQAARQRLIVRTSLVGVGTNVLLAAMKAVVGLLSHSIAVVLDAVNNLSDALSSVITIVGAKLSARRPDKKHPLGYGRIEYLSAMIVAALVLYAGLTALVESVKKIISPEKAEYSLLSLVLIGAAVLVRRSPTLWWPPAPTPASTRSSPARCCSARSCTRPPASRWRPMWA